MTPLYFATLPADQQSDILYYQADILANRYEGEHIYLLYSLNDFYVELRYDAYRNQLQQVNPFRDTNQLEPYLPYLA